MSAPAGKTGFVAENSAADPIRHRARTTPGLFDGISTTIMLVLVCHASPMRPAQAEMPVKAHPQRRCEDLPLDKGTALGVLLRGTPPGFWKADCHDEACRAIKDLGCAVTAQARRMVADPLAYDDYDAQARAFAIYGRTIAALGIEHQKRIPLYCKLLARVAATLAGERPTDRMTGDAVTQLALRLERPGQTSCVGQAAAATPPNPGGRGAMAEAIRCRSRIRDCQTCLDIPMPGLPHCTRAGSTRGEY